MPKGGIVIFKIDKLTKAVKESAKGAVLKAAYNIMRDAKRIARDKGIFDTGRLIGSISVNWEGSGKTFGDIGLGAKGEDGVMQPKSKGKDQFIAVAGSRVSYSKFHEFGTSKMRARPFLRPAFEARKKDLEKELRRIK